MNKLSMIFITLLISCSSYASVTLHLNDNVTALAAQDSRVNMFSKDIVLPNEHQKIIVKFDSSINPESVNQGQGRITSTPYVISFNYNGGGNLTLSAGKVNDEKEAKAQAAEPQFVLMDGNNPVDFQVSKIDKESVNVFTDYTFFLNAPANNYGPAPLQPNEYGIEKAKSEFLKLNDNQKLAFMKWILNN